MFKKIKIAACIPFVIILRIVAADQDGHGDSESLLLNVGHGGTGGVCSIVQSLYPNWGVVSFALFPVVSHWTNATSIGLGWYYGFDELRTYNISLKPSVSDTTVSGAIAKDWAYLELRLGPTLAMRLKNFEFDFGCFLSGDAGEHYKPHKGKFTWDYSLINFFIHLKAPWLSTIAELTPFEFRRPSHAQVFIMNDLFRIDSRMSMMVLECDASNNNSGEIDSTKSRAIGDLWTEAAGYLKIANSEWGPLAGIDYRRGWISEKMWPIRSVFGKSELKYDRTIYEVGLHFPALTLEGGFVGSDRKAHGGGWLYINSLQFMTAQSPDGERFYGCGINRLEDYEGSGFPLRASAWIMIGGDNPKKFEILINITFIFP